MLIQCHTPQSKEPRWIEASIMPSQSRKDRDSKLPILARVKLVVAHPPRVDTVKAVHVIAASRIVTAQGPRVGVHAVRQRELDPKLLVAIAEKVNVRGRKDPESACDSLAPACDVYEVTSRWVDGEEVTFG